MEHAKEKKSMRKTIKRLQMQLRQVAKKVQDNRQGKLPSQSEQAKAVTILRSGKKVDNGISFDNDDDCRDVGKGKVSEDTTLEVNEGKTKGTVHINKQGDKHPYSPLLEPTVKPGVGKVNI